MSFEKVGREPRKRKHATKMRTGERAECLIACVPRHREGGPCVILLFLPLSLSLLSSAHNAKQQPRTLCSDYATRLAFPCTDCKL